ncbi:hypothetical protein PIB30_005839 [Stylosanthes scabra]|uniref:Uncharacterized protein n=1 Tax=Stylosanthes scabra TaxID=79078 RepID=A0ABU6Z0X2_9FABA|nr:hypothetical protein [Stylosanthes scabra]
MEDRKRSGLDDWSSGKYERWSSSASSGSVGIGYDNRPGTGSSLESWRSIHKEGRTSSFLQEFKSSAVYCGELGESGRT